MDNIAIKSYRNREKIQDDVREIYSGVDFINLGAETFLPELLKQVMSENDAIKSKLNKISQQLEDKNKECNRLKSRIDTLTKQKLHRDNIIEEHKEIQTKLRNSIEKLKQESAKCQSEK